VPAGGFGENRRMNRIRDVVFDSPHPASIARFWAAALDDYQVAPYDDAELERLRAKGIYDVNDDPTVLVEPAAAAQPGSDAANTVRLFFQLVPESKIVKNRLHLDITADDPAAEIDRLIKLGARMFASQEHLTTLTDPDGNEFCVLHAS
jgi:Glyoxalase-like domain